MAFDFKKEYKAFYLPKDKPEILAVPPMNYVAVQGQGDPNQPGGSYQQAIGVLYAVAYTIKMSRRSGHEIDGFFDYVVPPLEGFWWEEGQNGVRWAFSGNKKDFCWISGIRLPDFVTREDLNWAIGEASRKKGLDCSGAQFLTVEEGLCVQIMHVGPYDNEPGTIAKMDAFLEEAGYQNDFSLQRLHHEIYLSDARRVPPDKWRTVIRHPIRKGR